jgi:hypothetical protein
MGNAEVESGADEFGTERNEKMNDYCHIHY